VLTEGIWVVRFQVYWSAAGTRSGRSFVLLAADGTTYRRSALAIDTAPQSQECSSIIVVPEGTTKLVSLTVSQNNGAAMTIESTTNSNGGTFGEATLIGSLPPSMRLPNINVSVGPQEGPAPHLIDAHVENIGGTVTAYDWDWGDATAHGSGADASHTYSAPGTYTVTCTATGPKGTDTDTATVVVS
jgi:PKD repeat protein